MQLGQLKKLLHLESGHRGIAGHVSGHSGGDSSGHVSRERSGERSGEIGGERHRGRSFSRIGLTNSVSIDGDPSGRSLLADTETDIGVTTIDAVEDAGRDRQVLVVAEIDGSDKVAGSDVSSTGGGVGPGKDVVSVLASDGVRVELVTGELDVGSDVHVHDLLAGQSVEEANDGVEEADDEVAA